MKHFKHLKLLILFIFVSIFSFSQNCDHFGENYCTLPFDWDYEINSQSMNIPMFEGQTFKFSSVFYEGYDYYVGFCVHEELGAVEYRLLSTDVYLDKKFSGQENDRLEHIEFTNKTTRIIIIEVKVPRTSTYVDVSNKHCVGIIIGQKKTTDEF